jgi:Gram-negative bacterial TonB protein C-terminal
VAFKPAPRVRAPSFLVQPERLGLAWWESLKALYKTPRLRMGKTHSQILRDVHLGADRTNSRFQALSLVAHVALISALIYMPVTSRAREVMIQDSPGNAEKIYYRLTVISLAQKLPRIAPVGVGAQPGRGDLVERVPALGSTVRQHNLTVVSRPLRADNTRQTIFQPIVPPNLRITTELKLPNIVEARPVIVPKPKVALNAKESKPNGPNKRTLASPAPSLTVMNTTLTDLTNPTNAQPRLLVPPPPPADASPTPTTENAEVGANSAAGLESRTQNAGSGLVVVSTDPGQVSDMVALPTGNRWADFSISPAGSTAGSPGGTSQHIPSVGTGGGAGGDNSTGIGKGESGGGGGDSGEPGTLSVSGTGGSAASGTLGPGVPLSMVYPVVASLLPRRNSLVVSAGPLGGGGLNIYGALKCGKIYTVFLQMPGKAWTLQYCLSGDNKETRPSQTSSAVVHMEQGITPPDAELRFDFKRLPVSEDKVHKLIVLKGSLREDGAVENLQIHQGLLPMMDEAARLAFSQWKFKPATRGGRAIPVDILVGIPADPVPAPKTN